MSSILGNNSINIDVTYDKIKTNKFPIEWTTSSLEIAIPGLCKKLGRNKPMSVRFRNSGSPKFLFSRDELTVVFSMEADMYSKDYS